MNESEPARTGESPVHLTLWDTVSIIIGIVIGAGIYETAPYIFQNVPNPAVALAVWAAGGLLSLIGALCYAELATTYPRSGGDYVYLTRAFGRWAGFLFGWCQLAVLMTGSIGMMAYIFADYGARLLGLNAAAMPFMAAGAVIVLTATNMLGVVLGKGAQNLLTLAKVVGIGAILVMGFAWGARVEAAAAPSAAATTGSIGLALVLVLYTYGGWNDAALVAAEIKDRRRNIPRALILGTLLLTVIYMLVNGAYIAGLGFEGARQSGQIAADLLEARIGAAGASAISLLVMISALGAINGLIYTGSRIYSSMGADYRFFSSLARWNEKRQTPLFSLGWQCLVTLGLILLVGTGAGRAGIDASLGAIGIAGVSWQGRGGFDTLLRCTAPVFWLFFLGTGLSLFVLRWRDPTRERPFVVPLYPVLPLVFCAMCGYMLYSSVEYAGKLVLIGLVPLVLGLAVYMVGGHAASVVPSFSQQQIKQETTT